MPCHECMSECEYASNADKLTSPSRKGKLDTVGTPEWETLAIMQQ